MRFEDEEGQLLHNADQAWEAAKATPRALMAPMAGNPDATTEWLASRFELTDYPGAILEFPFHEAVEATDERH